MNEEAYDVFMVYIGVIKIDEGYTTAVVDILQGQGVPHKVFTRYPLRDDEAMLATIVAADINTADLRGKIEYSDERETYLVGRDVGFGERSKARHCGAKLLDLDKPQGIVEVIQGIFKAQSSRDRHRRSA